MKFSFFLTCILFLADNTAFSNTLIWGKVELKGELNKVSIRLIDSKTNKVKWSQTCASGGIYSFTVPQGNYFLSVISQNHEKSKRIKVLEKRVNLNVSASL